MACLVVAVDEAGDADGLLGEALGHHLVGALGLLADAVPGEDGVAHAHQDVVHAVQLHELHAAPPHVRQDAVVAQRAVQPTVPVGGPAVEKDYSVHMVYRGRNSHKGPKIVA